MNLTFEPEAPPLRVDEAGAVRVGKTRVLMVIVVDAFRGGESPEEIGRAYPTLTPAEVYGVIAYYLRHKAEVEEYIAGYDRQSEAVWRKIDAAQGELPDLRARSLARRQAQHHG